MSPYIRIDGIKFTEADLLRLQLKQTNSPKAA